MAAWGASNRSSQLRSVNRVDFVSPDHHQDMCLNRNLSKILRLPLNREIGESPSNTWPRMNASIKIGQVKKSGDVGLWPT